MTEEFAGGRRRKGADMTDVGEPQCGGLVLRGAVAHTVRLRGI